MTAVDPANPNADLATVPTPAARVILNAGYFAAPGNPDVLGIASGPPAVTNVLQNTLMTLKVVAKPPGVAATYQWSRWDGVSTFTNIPGATSPTYSQFVDLPDEGSQFRITVSLPAGLNPSLTTLLHVIRDTNAPV